MLNPSTIYPLTFRRTPEEQLEHFKASVSWAGDCQIQYFGKIPYTQTENLVLFPAHWDDLPQITPWIENLPKSVLNCEIGIIIDGDCPDYECDRINYMLGVWGICPFWLMAKQKVYWSRWLQSLSDGIDIIAEAKKSAGGPTRD
jgi:hypothetical protein